VERAFGIIPVDQTRERTCFLIIQHRAGHWAFPKGKPEPGETELQSALRELQEETGIRAVSVCEEPVFEEHYMIQTGSGSTPAVAKTVRYFLGLVQDPRVVLQEAEVQAYKWATLDEARELITFDASRQLLEQAARAVSAL
jgi:8-oxo-dGTP pyrophosphatase MutT (NUDIX family)